MYTMILVMMWTFGYQTSVLTLSLDNIHGLDECQAIGREVAAQYGPEYKLDQLTCVPQDGRES